MDENNTYVQFFKEEIHVHYSAVRYFACTLTKDPNTADDLTQEVMLRAWINVEKMQDYINVKSALMKMAKNIHNDYYRNKQNTISEPANNESISEVAEPSNILVHLKAEAIKAELDRIFEYLSEEEKRIILQYDVFERSMIEISKEMNLTTALPFLAENEH